MDLEKFEKFLQSVNLDAYRKKYNPIKIVEMDLPKEIQPIDLLYKVYWNDRKFLDYEDFYKEYLKSYKKEIEMFRRKRLMCKKCFYLGLPARIYRTWASLITQIHAGYVAESVFGAGSVEMSGELDHKGADFRVSYKNEKLNYQVKKESESREVRRDKKSKKKLDGKFIEIKYSVPDFDKIKNPRKKNGKGFYKAYLNFKKNYLDKGELKVFKNGFVIFTPLIFKKKKKEIDSRLK